MNYIGVTGQKSVEIKISANVNVGVVAGFPFKDTAVTTFSVDWSKRSTSTLWSNVSTDFCQHVKKTPGLGCFGRSYGAYLKGKPCPRAHKHGRGSKISDFTFYGTWCDTKEREQTARHFCEDRLILPPRGILRKTRKIYVDLSHEIYEKPRVFEYDLVNIGKL